MFSFRTTPISEQLDKYLNQGRIGVFCTQNCYDTSREEYLWELFEKRGMDVKIFYPTESYLSPSSNHIDFAPEDLENLDAVVIEIQDIGGRNFCYFRDVLRLIDALKETMIPVYVVDHVNPQERLSEGSFNSKAKDFTAFPFKHGLTLGEAIYFYENQIGATFPLHVIAAFAKPGYGEIMSWTVAPSPDAPGLFSPQLFPGFSLFNYTNITPGIGTARPYEYIGAPFVKIKTASGDLNTSLLPHNPAVRMRPCSFIPSAGLYKGQQCFGYQIILVPGVPYHSVLHALSLIKYFLKEYPREFQLSEGFDAQLADEKFKAYLTGALTDQDLLTYTKESETKWARKAKKWLLY